MDRTPTESSSGDIASTGDVDNIEDARKLVRDLRQKTRAQAQQIMAWRRAYKMQVRIPPNISVKLKYVIVDASDIILLYLISYLLYRFGVFIESLK